MKDVMSSFLRSCKASAILFGPLLGGAALLGVPGPVASADSFPRPIQQAVDAGVKVEKSFSAASGLTGWVLSQGGQHSVVFTTADKKTLIAGTLIGENGENLSSRYEEDHVPKPDFGSLLHELDKSSYVVEGAIQDPKKTIYVFVDANCPFCHLTWKALQPYEKAGLQVRWILVATLGPTSMPKAIEVLAAEDKTVAFRKMEENSGKAWTPPAKASEAASPGAAVQIRNNTELMARFGIAGTPGVIWKDARGKVNVKGGMPRLSELPGITGLPEQKVDDPALAKFR
ncbi:Thiol:disulfide interchange protein DsbC [Noviherbaspirillum suwonense]|uniref:Thiol:disulfide interchange protein n=2 Tax=Noviherbaspirillum suwonense TaxID=1224511 RepID=A0ABY1QBJ1_9BURK|nr:Thiol:disulfide interchange protein DsbC [Noviherbaspirillum suwonense]